MIAETYVTQIVKKIRCSRKKRREIHRQILADITSAMQQGDSLEKVMLRMGEPVAIAEAFNESLPERERRIYKRGILLKAAAALAAVLVILILLAGWFVPRGYAIGTNGAYDANEVERQAKEIIRLLDAEDYDTLLARSIPRMQKVLTKEIIDDAKAQTGVNEDWGRLLEFGKCYMQEVKQQGKTLAVAQITAAYEHAWVTYTVLFDKEMLLAGIYIK